MLLLVLDLKDEGDDADTCGGDDNNIGCIVMGAFAIRLVINLDALPALIRCFLVISFHRFHFHFFSLNSFLATAKHDRLLEVNGGVTTDVGATVAAGDDDEGDATAAATLSSISAISSVFLLLMNFLDNSFTLTTRRSVFSTHLINLSFISGHSTGM
jgi:hypothetical protein